jgi:hypothetical protein
MHRTRGELLAGPRLPQDEHGFVRAGEAPERVAHAPHHVALADEAEARVTRRHPASREEQGRAVLDVQTRADRQGSGDGVDPAASAFDRAHVEDPVAGLPGDAELAPADARILPGLAARAVRSLEERARAAEHDGYAVRCQRVGPGALADASQIGVVGELHHGRTLGQVGDAAVAGGVLLLVLRVRVDRRLHSMDDNPDCAISTLRDCW